MKPLITTLRRGERRQSIPGYGNSWGWLPLILCVPTSLEANAGEMELFGVIMLWQLAKGLIFFAGMLWIIRKIETVQEAWETLKKDVAILAANMVTLKQFICESKSLQSDIAAFKMFNLRHEWGYGREDCVCGKFQERAGVIQSRDQFYRATAPKEDFDPASEGEILYQEDQFRDWVGKEIFPLIERLHELEPRRVTMDHVRWFQSHDNCYEAPNFLTWLLAELRRKSRIDRKEIKNEEALKILDKLSHHAITERGDKE